jgi:ubiquinone/menaquinone biosynthesis C-methylase UbiE
MMPRQDGPRQDGPRQDDGDPMIGHTPVDPYAGAAHGWATGAHRVYQPLAAELVGRSPHALRGRLVLDVGAGTGLGSGELVAAGARPVAVDRSPDMLAWQRSSRPPAVVGDVTRLPLRDGAVDDVLAAFVLNHLEDPAAGLAELARVIRPGGVLLASVYSNASHSDVRDQVDAAAIAHGFAFPAWYLAMKASVTPLLGSAAALARAAGAAGWTVRDIVERPVDVGVWSAADLVDYRFGQAAYARWLAGLVPTERHAVRHAAIAAVTPVMKPYRPIVVLLTATADMPGFPLSVVSRLHR